MWNYPSYFTYLFPGWNMYTWYDSSINAFEKLHLGWSYWIFPNDLRTDPALLAIFQKYWSLNWRPQGAVPRLQASGHSIVTENGENVTLRGLQLWIVGLAIQRQPPRESPTEEVFMQLNSWNVNHVRLVMDLESMMPTEGVWSTDFFQTLNTVIDFVEKYKIYVILDMHQHKQSSYFGGHGFPAWYVSRQGNITQEQFLSKWLNKKAPYQDSWDFVSSAWEKIIEVVKGRNIVIGYDLYNELGTAPAVRSFYEFLSSFIEVRDPGKLHFAFHNPHLDSDNTQKPAISNLVLSPHPYWEFDPLRYTAIPYVETLLAAGVIVTVMLFAAAKLKRKPGMSL